MLSTGFFDRLRNSTDRVLLGLDLFFSIVITSILFGLVGPSIYELNADALVEAGTSFSGVMVAIIITGISIMVSMSNNPVAVTLKRKNEYENFLFTFEFTAFLALVTSVIGVISQTVGQNVSIIYIYIFMLVYTVLAVATVISRIITYGDRVATINAINDIPEDISEVVRKENQSESENESHSEED